MTSYRADKLVIDTHAGNTDAGNDNARRPKWPRVMADKHTQNANGNGKILIR